MKSLRAVFLAVAAAALSACAPFQVHTTLPVSVVRSPNFELRRPNYIILHHTSGDSTRSALDALTSPLRRVSAHYLIGRDGNLYQLVEEHARAWHAGPSWWGGQTDMNSASIGIELDNNGEEAYPEVQIETLLALLADLRLRHGIPTANVIGHSDIAPGRKVDPGPPFPWQRLAAKGFGLWCDFPLPAAPADFDLPLTLTALGYNPSTPEVSRQAFRLHFMRDAGQVSDALEKAMAYCLLHKRGLPSR